MGNVIEKITDIMPTLSKGQKRLASFILTDYDRAAFMTAAKLGEVCNVSESTAVRFAKELGYKGFPEFQADLSQVVRNKLDSIDRIEIDTTTLKQSQVMEAVMKADIEKIRLTMESMDNIYFDTAVDILNEAKTIYVVGVRSGNCRFSSFLSGHNL